MREASEDDALGMFSPERLLDLGDAIRSVIKDHDADLHTSFILRRFEFPRTFCQMNRLFLQTTT